jgi:xanthine dehydrogenase YagS FAD-binding subunit
MLTNFSYIRAASLSEAIQNLAAEGARLHAGGTDLLGCLRDDVFTAEKIVSIGRLDELRRVRANAAGGLRIGSLVTIAQLAAQPQVKEKYPGLAQAAADVASPQLRNQGTIGGNLCQKPRCWYYRGEFHCLRKGGDTCYALEGQNEYHCIFGRDLCCIVHPSDTAPALVALDATVRVRGPAGERDIRAADFHVLPAVDVHRETVLGRGEIVTEILLPPPPRGLRSSYRKVRARRAWDFALAGVALALRFEGKRVMDGRVVLGGAAPVPWRSRPAEEAIAGRELDDDTIAAAAAACVRDAQPLEHNGYKIPLFEGLLEEELRAIRP